MPEFYIICNKSWFLSILSNSSNNDAQRLLDGSCFPASAPIQLFSRLSASEVSLISHSSSMTHWICPSNANQALLHWAASLCVLLCHGITLRNAPPLLSLRKTCGSSCCVSALRAAGSWRGSFTRCRLETHWAHRDISGTKTCCFKEFSLKSVLNFSSVWISSVCNTSLSPSLGSPFLFNFNLHLSMLKWNVRRSPERGYQGFEVRTSFYHCKYLSWGDKVL